MKCGRFRYLPCSVIVAVLNVLMLNKIYTLFWIFPDPDPPRTLLVQKRADSGGAGQVVKQR
jgi:hypothetical protein